ncbi:MAG TPA: DUF3147 family protein [Steroidobacteraceae bacterium]
MTVSIDLSALRDTHWHQHVLRFVLGGAVTLAAGLLAKHFGAVFGGLFLAFPAIFPASATLIAKRERQKKQRKGLQGAVRARRAAALDAAGTTLGAVGLMCFAGIVWQELPAHATALVLSMAALSWLVISTLFWRLRKRHSWRRPWKPPPPPISSGK